MPKHNEPVAVTPENAGRIPQTGTSPWRTALNVIGLIILIIALAFAGYHAWEWWTNRPAKQPVATNTAMAPVPAPATPPPTTTSQTPAIGSDTLLNPLPVELYLAQAVHFRNLKRLEMVNVTGASSVSWTDPASGVVHVASALRVPKPAGGTAVFLWEGGSDPASGKFKLDRSTR